MHKSEVYILLTFDKCIHLCNQPHQDIEHFCQTQDVPSCSFLGSLHLHPTVVLFFHLGLVFLFLEFHINSVIQFLLFCARLLETQVLCF